MKIFVETPRFILREIFPKDVNGMYELDSDPEVHKYLGNNPLTNRDQTLKVIEQIRQQYIDNGIARWAIIDKKTNKFIGWTGLKFVSEETNHHKNYFDLGYRIIKKYWGNGIAFETALATIEYAFEKLKIDEIYAIADSEHTISNKILTKVGFKFIESFMLDGIKHNWYKIEIAAFETSKERQKLA